MSQNPSLCGVQFNYIMESLHNHSMWSMEMLDLSGKLPVGILNQHNKVFGLFDECLEFKHQTAEVGLIEGQYCAVSYESSLNGSSEVSRTHGLDWVDIGFVAHERNLKLQSGVCAPACCSPEEFRTFMNFILSKADLVATQVSCSKARHISEYFTAWDFLAIPFFVILILVVAASTYCDIRQRRSEEHPRMNLLTAFSLYTNTKELLRIDTSHSTTSIDCINGIRTLATFWVVCGHQTSRASSWRNFFMSRTYKQSFILDIFMRAGYAVDIFIICGAIVMTKSCLKAYESGKFNLLKFYFNRYMRYGPGVGVAILFMLSFIPHALVSGPVRYTHDDESKKCHQYWWHTLFMTLTYTNPNAACLGHLWYLSNDFHFYLVSPIITYILWKFGFKSFWLFVPAVIGGFAYKEYALIEHTVPSGNIYIQAHFRIWQWILGSMFGYAIHQAENSSDKIEISKKIRNIVWASVISGFIFLYSKAVESEFFLNILVGWAIFAFHHFHSGGTIRWFLSHPLWQPLAKLTLSIYIVHAIYLILFTANVQELAFFKTGWLLHIMAGDIVICTFIGLVFYLFVEAPVANLMKIFMRTERKKEILEVTEEGYVPLINEIDEIVKTDSEEVIILEK